MRLGGGVWGERRAGVECPTSGLMVRLEVFGAADVFSRDPAGVASGAEDIELE